MVSKGTIIGTIGKMFASEMEIRDKGGSNLFPITHILMVRNLPEASVRPLVRFIVKFLLTEVICA